MKEWWFVYLLTTTTWSLVKPLCLLCSPNCILLPKGKYNITSRLYVKCDPNYDPYLENFLKINNFTQTESFTLLTGQMKNLSLTQFQSIPHIDFSLNNLTFVNLTHFNETITLNLSHNSIIDIIGDLPSIKKLDLSYNKLKDINLKLLKNSTKITSLILRNNSISSLQNFSSNSLQYLNLENNIINKLDLGICQSLKEIDLSNNIIKIININISYYIPSIEILNVSYNLIESLSDYNFNLSNLLKLDLQKNKISNVKPKCFSGLNKLQYLNIGSNQIQIISPNTFQYLPGLIHLIISDNSYLQIPDYSLMLSSGRLKSLDVSKTNQNQIPSSLTRSIQYLYLSSNHLHQIQSGDLDSYPLVNSLDLSINNLSFIEDDAFGRLELLTFLNLNDNMLTNIPRTLPNNLKVLLISHNNIKTLSNNDFVGLGQLTEFDISFNQIQELNETSLSLLYSLEKLNLSGNPIKLLSSNSFVGLKNLKKIDLSFLLKLHKCEQTLCFPVPEYNNLRELNLKNSTILAKIFITDVAALKTFKQLNSLNLANTNLTNIKKDLLPYLPRLNYLNLNGNNFNCNEIKKLFLWFYLKELTQCEFLLSEKHSKLYSKDLAKTKMTTLHTTMAHDMKIQTERLVTPSTTTDKVQKIEYKNNTLLFNLTFDDSPNDVWYGETIGVVDAFSAETPTSHPSLFILLLLPIGLISTCLILNYSRLKRTQTYSKKSEMDIEIANISSDLW